LQEKLSDIWVQCVDLYQSQGDKRVKDWPLMNPVHMLMAVAAYLVVIGLLVLFMKNREPFKLKAFSTLHNIHLTALSAYMCIEIIRQAVINNYSLFGNAVDHSEDGYGMARIIWIYYLSKIPEFFDTVIMALKKNFHQITFLHLYHHASIFMIWWVITYFGPGGEAYFSACLNSFIHVVMYGYYLWSANARKLKKDANGKLIEKPGPTHPAFYRSIITSMQLTQFCCMLCQSIYDLVVPNDYPRFCVWILFFYMFTMLALFGNFFMKQYVKKGSKGSKKKAQ